MANTEKINVLKLVREAETIITQTLDKPGLTKPQRKILEDLSDLFRDIDDMLILNELNDSIEELKSKSEKLQTLNERIKNHIKNLEEVAGRVEKAAKGVDAIVKAFGILVAADLL